MPSTYISAPPPQPEAMPPDVKEEPDQGEKPKAVGSKQPRPDISLPEDVRRAFAVKIWALLGMQMMATGVIAAVVDRLVPDSTAGHDPEEEGYDDLIGPSYGLLIWFVSAVVCFASLGVLRAFRHRVPINFIVLGMCLPIIGFFWGAAKFVLIATFSLNLLTIVCLSLFCSSIFWASGLAQGLGKKMKPSEAVVQNKLEMAEGKPPGTMNPDSDPAMREKLQLIAQNDGLARSTVALGVVSWCLASVADVMVVQALVQDDTSAKDSNKSVVYAIVIGLFLSIWFHGDAIWHIRRCNVDEYLDLIIDVNTDIFAAMIAFFACALAMACGESADPGSVDASVDGGVEGDAGSAEAHGRLPMGEVALEGPNRQTDDLESV